MLTAVTSSTGMSPLLSSMYFLVAAIMTSAPLTLAARLPIMNDLFEQNTIDEPIYTKYDRNHHDNQLLGEEPMVERVRVELKSPHVTRLTPGDRLELVCEANGTPPPKIQWFKGLELIQETGFDEQNDLSSMALASLKSRLVIDCVTKLHHGVYTCKGISGSSVKRSPPATVIVQGEEKKSCQSRLHEAEEPRILSWSPVTIATIQGDISLPCNVEGNPRPEIFWRNQDNVNVAADPRFQILKSGELVINKLHWSDMGEYTCIAISPLGRTQESTFLYPLSEEDIHFGASKKRASRRKPDTQASEGGL